MFGWWALGALLILPSARATRPVADYQFQNTLTSVVAGAPALAHLVDTTYQQPNTFVTASVDGVTRQVLHFPQFNGLVLPETTGLISPGVYSIVLLFSFEEITGWRRVLDFKSGANDNGVYTLNGHLDFYPVTSTEVAPITVNTFHQVAVTRDGAGQVKGYVDGAPVLEFEDSDGLGIVDGNNRLRFFQDNTGGNAAVRESSAGNVARIRVYNVALTGAEIAGLDRLPGVWPDRIRLLRIVGGLEAATPGDVAQWDANGDKALTMADVVAMLRS